MGRSVLWHGEVHNLTVLRHDSMLLTGQLMGASSVRACVFIYVYIDVSI